jgi:hypothetical protein
MLVTGFLPLVFSLVAWSATGDTLTGSALHVELPVDLGVSDSGTFLGRYVEARVSDPVGGILGKDGQGPWPVACWTLLGRGHATDWPQ